MGNSQVKHIDGIQLILSLRIQLPRKTERHCFRDTNKVINVTTEKQCDTAEKKGCNQSKVKFLNLLEHVF